MTSSHGKVLIVDDDRDASDIVSIALTDAGFMVACATCVPVIMFSTCARCRRLRKTRLRAARRQGQVMKKYHDRLAWSVHDEAWELMPACRGMSQKG
jgi:DNA-binding NtrC family response regulator